MSFDYHVLVLGGGLAYVGAELLLRKGFKVAIVEKEPSHLGGVCLHEGCVPTKLYLFEANKLFDLKNSPLIKAQTVIDLKALKEKKNKLTKRLRDDIEKLLKGAEFIYGYGELIEPHVVQVEGKRLSAQYVLINTGKSYYKSPNAKDLLELEEVPQKLFLVGDDPIALEFACLFALLGASVELYFEEKSLDFMHTSIKSRLFKMLKDLNIELKPLQEKEGAYYLYRRKANSECIKIELAKDDKGHLLVDKNYETSVKNHYAIGDVNGICELAHASRIQALSVAKRIITGEGFYIQPHKIPYVLYTQPISYAKVGFTKKELQEKGIEHTEKSVSLRPFAVGEIYHTEEGIIFLYFDKKNFLLGAEVFCRNAGEIISSLAVSLFSELNLEHLQKLCLPHPTLSEVAFLRI